jgi:D-tyrosyl-tRNA(Tyr) deacylase
VRALLQRVSRASVSIQGQEIASIGPGLVILLGIARQDTDEDARYLVDKSINLCVFADETGRFNRSALDTMAELLIVSQFTLYAETRKGRRPDFTAAAPPQEAEDLYQRTVQMFQESGLKVATGRFREVMAVSIHNQGPVTLMLDSADRHKTRRG